MESAFKNTNTFNQDIGDWNTSAVVKMNDMFYNASGFNQSLHSWDVTSVNDFNTIFQGTSSLSDANKAAIHSSFKSNSHWTTDWSSFIGSTPLTDSNFQSALNTWFGDEAYAIATYGHIQDWNTSAVTNMSAAFVNRSDFNEDISNWDVVMSQTSPAYLRVQNLLINRLETGIPLRLPLSILFSREPRILINPSEIGTLQGSLFHLPF